MPGAASARGNLTGQHVAGGFYRARCTRPCGRRSLAAIQPKILFVAGAFHLVAKDPEMEGLIATLRDTYKVAYVAPGHCTGEPTFTAR